MIKPVPADCDAQRIHVREVRGRQTSWLMFLCEHHSFRRPSCSSPQADPAFKCATLRIRESSGIFPLKFVKQRDGFQPGIPLQQVQNLRPDGPEGVFANSPVSIYSHLRRHLRRVPILPCRRLVHIGFPCSCSESLAAIECLTQNANLSIPDHCNLLSLRRLRS